MSGVMPDVLPFLPGFIPPDLDLDKVLAEVGADGVSAPLGVDEAGLRQIVSEARADGIDLKIVVIDHDPHIDTPLRDIATEVGIAYPDSTVLALSPSFAGTYSGSIDRVTLEAGQDLAKTGNPVQSAQNFVDQITTDDFPWTLLTIALVLFVAAAAAATRLLQVWSKRTVPAAVDDGAKTPVEQG
ncbi:hypothetical protein JRC04_03035 [Mycolicibacterium sp. S2-37]|uniref:Rv1476 family membrane protein n=1 Tax=Mycolicibacterium sp. S2-37 TaxID=2810297 RepID=UPI001A94F751|nr:DUF6676 family protein [Mycolicibacterium sp. S2-37]MBO0676434.1 hypothetical protein [Mycolicibacterium sp. S2-37]